jgi:hypothetical protein
MTTTPINFNYNNRTNVLTIFDTNNLVKVLVEVLKTAGESEVEFDNLYSHIWICQMATARSYLQWHRNISKYSGPVFDGNIIIDKEAIKIMGDDMYHKAISDLSEKWSDSFGSVYVP